MAKAKKPDPDAKPMGFVVGGPRILLRIEGAAMALGAIVAYLHCGGSFWIFILLVLLPDTALAGYLIDRRVGVACYDAVHTSFPAILMAIVGVLDANTTLICFAAIWLTHIGIERMIGLGLRYGDGFAYTHLGKFRMK